MYEIRQITDEPHQEHKFTLYDGSSLSMTIQFVEMQLGWFIRQLQHSSDFTLHNLRITNNLNMLYQFKNILPFGLACFSRENREPTLQRDFLVETSKLFILDADETEEYTEILSAQST